MGLSMWQKTRYYLVEPAVLILVFAYNLSATVWKNQIIYQTCTTIFHHNTTDCKKLSTKDASDYIKSIETEVQSYTVVFFMTNSLIQSIVPALCGTFVGAWSDRFGRKPLLIASFTGYFLFYALTCLISHLSDSYAVDPWFYILPSIPLSLLGDGVTYSVAAFCYISDVSTAKERPYRMNLYEAVIYIGLMSGSFVSGYIYNAYESATLIFFISSMCILWATLIVIFLIPESLNMRQISSATNAVHKFENPQHKNDTENSQATTSANISSTQSENNKDTQGQTEVEENRQHSRNRLRKLFDIDHLKAMYLTCFKAREFETRSVILLIVACLWTCAFVVEGSSTVFYLFVREKFQWTVKDFTTYETISILIPILGNVLGVWLLRRVFKMQILTVAIYALLSQASSSLMKGFAAVNWQLYLAIALGILKSVVNPMLRTILTNLLPPNELGKIFSFISAIQAFMPFVASPLYTIIYRSTLTSFPGLFNIINANLFIVAIGFILVILRKKQKYPEHYTAILN
ncbi:probable peptidoglycan muropeptide transporter SLC46 [Musca vetustissima]|uniref:probable peptidoglycan muropeptide transporter SLC46 n=1 Tax=Musca vetustissima TaxID=27455 RepID=UPI002AB64352|nr:probable peptidoglycan muropeptide transporter SLC46 [Musca vetustissima]